MWFSSPLPFVAYVSVAGKLVPSFLFFFFQAEDGIRDGHVTGVQTCALPIWQLGWGAYCATYLLLIYNINGHETTLTMWCSKVLFPMVPLFFFASTRLISTSEFPLNWRDVALLGVFMLWAASDTRFDLAHSQSAENLGAYFVVGGLQIPFG